MHFGLINLGLVVLLGVGWVEGEKYDDFDDHYPTYTGPLPTPPPGAPSNYHLSTAKWQKTSLKWFYKHVPIHSLSVAGLRKELKAAFAHWGAVIPLTFTETFNEKEADFTIFLARWNHHKKCKPFDGAGNVLAHAYFPFNPEWDSIAGDIHFDSDEPYTLDQRDTKRKSNGRRNVDFQTVAIHEIGHALGLYHSRHPDSIMLASYNGPHRFLAQDDIDGIQAKYGKRKKPAPAPRPRPRPTPAPTPRPRPRPTPSGSVGVTYDFGKIDHQSTAKLMYFKPKGTQKEWAAAMNACQKAGGVHLLHLASEFQRKKFLAHTRSSAFQRAAKCGRDQVDKMCRPWIGAKVLKDQRTGRNLPFYVNQATSSTGWNLKAFWPKAPILNDDWDLGNGVHMVLAGSKPYIHDAGPAWKRASFICEFR